MDNTTPPLTTKSKHILIKSDNIIAWEPEPISLARSYSLLFDDFTVRDREALLRANSSQTGYYSGHRQILSRPQTQALVEESSKILI